MTVNIPQKAGFMPTVQEWDQLVNVAEYIAQRALKMEAERDAARAEVVKLRSDLSLVRDEYSAANDDAHKWAALANEKANELDAACAELVLSEEARSALRLEVARLKNELRELSDGLQFLADGVIPNNASLLVPWAQFARAALRQPAQALTPIEYKRMTTGEWKYPAPGQEALRQPAPAQE